MAKIRVLSDSMVAFKLSASIILSALRPAHDGGPTGYVYFTGRPPAMLDPRESRTDPGAASRTPLAPGAAPPGRRLVLRHQHQADTS